MEHTLIHILLFVLIILQIETLDNSIATIKEFETQYDTFIAGLTICLIVYIITVIVGYVI